MKVAQFERNCVLCMDRREALSLLRLAHWSQRSLAVPARGVESEDVGFARQLESTLLSALRSQLEQEVWGAP
jgi:hypothetical protein